MMLLSFLRASLFRISFTKPRTTDRLTRCGWSATSSNHLPRYAPFRTSTVPFWPIRRDMLLLRFLAVIGTATGKGITRPAGRLAPSVGRSRSLDSRRSDLVAGSLLAAEAGLLFLLFFPK